MMIGIPGYKQQGQPLSQSQQQNNSSVGSRCSGQDGETYLPVSPIHAKKQSITGFTTNSTSISGFFFHRFLLNSRQPKLKIFF